MLVMLVIVKKKSICCINVRARCQSDNFVKKNKIKNSLKYGLFFNHMPLILKVFDLVPFQKQKAGKARKNVNQNLIKSMQTSVTQLRSQLV